MRITAHQLAQKLLAGPDLEVWFQDEESLYSGYVEDKNLGDGIFCACDDFPDEDSEEEPPWTACVTLPVGSTDTILEGDHVPNH